MFSFCWQSFSSKQSCGEDNAQSKISSIDNIAMLNISAAGSFVDPTKSTTATTLTNIPLDQDSYYVKTKLRMNDSEILRV